MRDVLIGQTDYTVLVRITGTDGAPETGLAHTDIDIAYSRVETDNDVTTSDVAPADLASLTAAHSDWGWEEVSATDHPGLYRLDIADAVFAIGAWEAVVTITDASGSDFYAHDIGFRLVNIDPQASNLPANVAQWAGTNVATPTVAGVPEVDLTHVAGSTTDVSTIPASVAAILVDTGTTLQAELDGIQADTEDIQTRLPAALVGGRIDASVGAMAANVMTAAAAAADFGAELQALITGGAYALSTDANGRIRIVDGTGAGELDTNAGMVGLTAAALASINAEADAALADIHLDHLIAVADPGGVVANSSFLAKLVSKSATPAFSDFDNTTDAMQAIRDRGDAAWITATGFSTHSAADVWAVATRLLTAGTNIVLAKGTGVTGFNDLDAAGVRSAVGLASANLDIQLDALPTANENRNAITGGAYSLDTDANGRVRIVDGTGTGELDTTSGLVKISGTIQTLDALDTAQDSQHATTQAAIAALSIPTVAQILTTQMTESYAANGVAPTLAQSLFAIHQKLMQHRYVGEQSIVYKLDNVTQAFVGTLDDDTNPTSDRRAA